MVSTYWLADADEREVAQVPASRTVLRRRTAEQSLIAPDVLKQLSRPQEWQTIGAIAMQWGLIALAIAVSIWSDSWFVTIPMLAFIATRQHALLIMMHDAAHFLISHNRAVNDTVSNLFCAFPFLVSNKRYRINHLLHHRYVNTADDPDLNVNVHPESRLTLALELIQDLLCLSILKTIRRSRKFGVLAIFFTSQPGFATERTLFLGFVATVTAVVALLPCWTTVPAVLGDTAFLVPPGSGESARIRGTCGSHRRRPAHSCANDRCRAAGADRLRAVQCQPASGASPLSVGACP